ncbi:MAG: anti-sigma factor family protein, partial [Bryobacteraceae bacterium]
MICWSVKRRTHGYVDRKLGSLERAWIERHLRACESCSAYFE